MGGIRRVRSDLDPGDFRVESLSEAPEIDRRHSPVSGHPTDPDALPKSCRRLGIESAAGGERLQDSLDARDLGFQNLQRPGPNVAADSGTDAEGRDAHGKISRAGHVLSDTHIEGIVTLG